MSELTLEQFLEEKNPDALDDYRRYLNRHNLPKKGETVISLKAGMGGLGGQHLTVLGRSTDPEFAHENYGDDYIILQGYRSEYLAETSNWWEKIEVVALSDAEQADIDDILSERRGEIDG
jgi:hypothetical protein